MKDQVLSSVPPPTRAEWEAYLAGTLPPEQSQAVEAYIQHSPLAAAAHAGFSNQKDTTPMPTEVPWGSPTPSRSSFPWNYLIVLALLAFVSWSAYRYWQHQQPTRVVAQYLDQLPDQLASRSDERTSDNVRMARQQAQSGNTALALDYYQAHLDDQPGDFASHMEAGKLALQERIWPRAMQHYEIARFNSDNYYGSATFGLALVHIETGDKAGAQRLLEELTAATDVSPELRQSIALLLQQLKETDYGTTE